MDRTALLAAVSGSDGPASGSGRDGSRGSDEVHPIYPHDLEPKSGAADWRGQTLSSHTHMHETAMKAVRRFAAAA